MIQLSHISKAFPDGDNHLNQVLRDVNLEVGKGDFITVMGASGSGKTTLLSILGTLLAPDEGSYRLDGKEMFAPDVALAAVRNQQIGFVFQEHRLMPQLTVRDNILLPTLAAQSKPDAEQLAYSRQLMEMTGIDALAGQYPQHLSGGEAGRTALCRALVMKPLLLLADEPTGQLDAGNAANIIRLLTQINKELHTTIIMVTHAPEVASAANSILTLKNGTLV